MHAAQKYHKAKQEEQNGEAAKGKEQAPKNPL